jgi:hypothetical protein
MTIRIFDATWKLARTWTLPSGVDARGHNGRATTLRGEYRRRRDYSLLDGYRKEQNL